MAIGSWYITNRIERLRLNFVLLRGVVSTHDIPISCSWCGYVYVNVGSCGFGLAHKKSEVGALKVLSLARVL